MTTIKANALFDFSARESLNGWTIVDDVVMGGVSRGALRHMPDEGGFARFSGLVRLENNGGFSSIQVRFRPADLSAQSGLHLHLRGDGKRYGIFMQSGTGPLVYQYDFATTGAGWEDVLAPFARMMPNWYGQPVTAPPPDLARISRISLIVPDKQAGAFTLDIARIGVYASV